MIQPEQGDVRHFIGREQTYFAAVIEPKQGNVRQCTDREQTYIAPMIEQKNEGKAPKKLSRSPMQVPLATKIERGTHNEFRTS